MPMTQNKMPMTQNRNSFNYQLSFERKGREYKWLLTHPVQYWCGKFDFTHFCFRYKLIKNTLLSQYERFKALNSENKHKTTNMMLLFANSK